MKSIILVVLGAALLLSGCTALHKSQPSAPLNAVIESKLSAHIQVGDKIEGEASNTCIFQMLCFGPNKFADGVYGASGLASFSLDFASNVKSAAVYDAVSRANADVIVAPKYVVEYNNYLLFSICKAKVSGYKGTIKDIH